MKRALFSSLLAVTAVAASLAVARSASAQTTLPMPEPAPAEPGDNETDSRVHEAPGSWKVFDSSKTRYTFDLFGGGIESRESHQQHWSHHGFQLGIGRSVEAHSSIFYASGQVSLLLRALDAKSYAFSFTNNTFNAGIVLGPLDLHTRVGLSLLTVDDIHAQVSAELLSPHAGIGVGLRVGKLAITLEGSSEYLWRWFGPSYSIRGISLDFQVDAPRPRTTMEDSDHNDLPTVFTSLPGFNGGGF